MVDRATVETQPTPAIDPNSENGVTATGAPGAAERPEWLPEKFGTPEELAKSYAELEAKLGGGSKGENDEQTGSTETNENTEGTGSNQTVSYGQAVDAALESAGLTPDAVFAEYQENDHRLSDATYDSLEKAGYPRDTVNQFIRGFEQETAETEAGTEADINQIMSDVGGQEEFNRMAEWAKTSLSEDDLALYNRLVDEGTPDTARMAVITLRGWYEAATGKEPALQTGGTRPSADVFTSPQEMAAAMAEARKSRDPAKIREVEHKALRSQVFG